MAKATSTSSSRTSRSVRWSAGGRAAAATAPSPSSRSPARSPSSRASGCRWRRPSTASRPSSASATRALGALAAAMVLVGVVGGIPFGALADRWRRSHAAVDRHGRCGRRAWASTPSPRRFAFLFVSRLGVGIVEANGPAAVSLMADYYPVATRARMMGRYQLGQRGRRPDRRGPGRRARRHLRLAGGVLDVDPVRRRSWSCSCSRLPRAGARRPGPRLPPSRRRRGVEADDVPGLLPDLHLPEHVEPAPPTTPTPAGATCSAELLHIRSMWFGLMSLTISQLLPRRPRRVGHRVLQAGLRPVGHRGRRLRPGHRRRRRHRPRRRRRAGRPAAAPRRRQRPRATSPRSRRCSRPIFLLPGVPHRRRCALAAVLPVLREPLPHDARRAERGARVRRRARRAARPGRRRSARSCGPCRRCRRSLVGCLVRRHRPVDRARHRLAALRRRRARDAVRRPHLPGRPGRRRPPRPSGS